MPGFFKRWSKVDSGSRRAAESAVVLAAKVPAATESSETTATHALPEALEYTHNDGQEDGEDTAEDAQSDVDNDLFKFVRPQTGQTRDQAEFIQNHYQQIDRCGVAYTKDEPHRGETAVSTASSRIAPQRYPQRGATGALRTSDLARPDTAITYDHNIGGEVCEGVVVVTLPQQRSVDVPTSVSPPPDTSPPLTTEAQRIARQYKLHDQVIAVPSTPVTAIGSLRHRRQGYTYPISPNHTAGLQAADPRSPARAHDWRSPSPVIELAEDDFHAALKLDRHGSRSRNDTDPQPPTYHSDTRYGAGKDVGDLASLASFPFDATRSVASTQTTHQKLFNPILAVYEDEKLDGSNGVTIAIPSHAYSRKRHSNAFEMAEIGSQSGAPACHTSSRIVNERHYFAGVPEHTPSSGIDYKTTLSAFQLDEEDSPYPEVAASVSNYDDPGMPCTTFRAIFLGLLFTMCGAAFNFFFLVRQPSPMLTPITIQVLAYPAGKLLDRLLPVTDYNVPKWLQRIGFPKTFSFNPGPFNVKEHTVITIMANVSISPSYALNTSLTLDHFYLVPKGLGFDLLFTISTSFIGFSFAGMCRRFLIWPASIIWPQNLVTCTLFNTFHAEEDDPMNGTSRFRMFLYISCGAFCWYFLPGFVFSAMSWFSFVCWIWPEHRVVNQLFGVASGLGMSAISLDWTQIAYVCSPLFVPWFAIINIFIGFVLIYWFIVPLIYYINVWNFAYLPISSDANFDRFGMPYNVSAVITTDIHIDEAAYIAYSPLFISTTFAVVYALSFVLMTALIAHTALYHGTDIWRKFRHIKTEAEDVHAKLMRNYLEVPDWWYAAIFIVFAAVAIAAIEGYDTELPVWALLLAVLIPAIYILPGGLVYSITAQLITVNLIAELVPGYLLPNKPIPNMIFKTFSIQCLQSGLYFVQDLKLGHYMKIPPRVTFHVQIIATLCASVAQVAVKESLGVIVKDLCSPDQSARMNCAIASVTFQASIIWGVIGPARFFGRDSVYHALLYFLLLGLFLPIPFYLASRRWPKSWITYVNIPVLINGVTFIPPASGINYSSWFLAGGVFQYYLRRHRFRWWSRYNFVASAGLDAGTVLSTIFIFFTLQLPKMGGLRPEWWGNTVYKKTFDWAGVPFKDAPPQGFGPTSWS